MLDSQLHLTEQVFEIYREEARRNGYEAGPQHLGYMFRVHVDDTEEKAYETGRKLIEGSGNVFLDGSNGKANVWAQNLAGTEPAQEDRLPARPSNTTVSPQHAAWPRALRTKPPPTKTPGNTRTSPPRSTPAAATRSGTACSNATPRSSAPQTPSSRRSATSSRRLRPGNVFFWHGDGDMSHEDSMRGIRYFGEYVLPAVREIGQELGLNSAFEIDPKTNQPFNAEPAALGGSS